MLSNPRALLQGGHAGPRSKAIHGVPIQTKNDRMTVVQPMRYLMENIKRQLPIHWGRGTQSQNALPRGPQESCQQLNNNKPMLPKQHTLPTCYVGPKGKLACPEPLSDALARGVHDPRSLVTSSQHHRSQVCRGGQVGGTLALCAA